MTTLELTFSTQAQFDAAVNFYESQSVFYPSQIMNAERTFIFTDDFEADVLEYYMTEELQQTELDGYYFASI